MVTQFGNAYVCGATPRCKRSTRNVQTRTHGLIQDWNPSTLFRRSPFWPSDLPLTSSPRPTQTHSRVTPGLYRLQLSNTHKEHPHRIHSSFSQEGIHEQLSLSLTLFLSNQKAYKLQSKCVNIKMTSTLRIKRSSQERLFHKHHTLIIQLNVWYDLHYFGEYCFIK